MWEVNRKNLWIPLLLVLVGIALLILGFTIDPAAGADDGSSARPVLLIMGMMFIGVTAATFAVFFIYSARFKRRLRAAGRRGVATILSSQATGDTVNNIPQVEMELRVDVEGIPSYTVTHREYINPVSLAAVRSGARIPVLVDPHRPKKVFLDW